MSDLKRVLNMVLRGKHEQFNNILQEELRERAAILLENVYKIEAQNVLLTSPETDKTNKTINNDKG